MQSHEEEQAKNASQNSLVSAKEHHDDSDDEATESSYYSEYDNSSEASDCQSEESIQKEPNSLKRSEFLKKRSWETDGPKMIDNRYEKVCNS
jgi:hypothetical protein